MNGFAGPTNLIDFSKTNALTYVASTNVMITNLTGISLNYEKVTLLVSNSTVNAQNIYASNTANANTAFHWINATNVFCPIAAGKIGLIAIEVWPGWATNVYVGQQTF
jgi:hypothetical protein